MLSCSLPSRVRHSSSTAWSISGSRSATIAPRCSASRKSRPSRRRPRSPSSSGRSRASSAGRRTCPGRLRRPSSASSTGADCCARFRRLPSWRLLDSEGREQLRISRQAMDQVGSNTDFSTQDKFKAAVANKVFYGPVYFRRGTEPFMTLAMAGSRRDAGVSVAEVNLTLHLGCRQSDPGRPQRPRLCRRCAGPADRPSRDQSGPAQYRLLAACPGAIGTRCRMERPAARRRKLHDDWRGKRVLAAYATAAPLNWLVLVELPEHEANEPLYTAIVRTVVVLVGGLILALLAALLLARWMVVPVRALAAGAARIGAGALDHRIEIQSGRRTGGAGRPAQRHGGQAAGLLRDAGAQGGGAHAAAAGGQPVEVALPGGGEPRPAPAAARLEPVRCAAALREGSRPSATASPCASTPPSPT